jgi:ABC-type glycerol-3-phosphate transport system substrate-binding protein
MRLLVLAALLTLGSCGETTQPKASDSKPVTTAAPVPADELKAEEKSIEEAADAAVKLIEEEVNAEIEQVNASGDS